MRRIPDILNTSLQSLDRSCFSNHFISKSVHSHSNNNIDKFDCQLFDKQINYCNEFLQEKLTTSEIKVLKVFMELDLKHKGVLHPSLARIASMAGCARSTVQLAIKKFQKLNIMKTEYRGYHQTLRYQIHEFYRTNRNKIASLLKNVFMIATLLLSRPAGDFSNRYLLKEKDAYLNQSIKFREKNVALQLTAAHYEEIKKHPKWIHDRTLAIFERKLKENLPIANPTGYFMGIYKQEAAKFHQEPSTKCRQSNIPKTGTTGPYVRPENGPLSIYKHNAERLIESDFDISTKLEMAFHTNPNSFSKVVADMNLQKLTKEERDAIMTVVHKECTCREEKNP